MDAPAAGSFRARMGAATAAALAGLALAGRMFARAPRLLAEILGFSEIPGGVEQARRKRGAAVSARVGAARPAGGTGAVRDNAADENRSFHRLPPGGIPQAAAPPGERGLFGADADAHGPLETGLTAGMADGASAGTSRAVATAGAIDGGIRAGLPAGGARFAEWWRLARPAAARQLRAALAPAALGGAFFGGIRAPLAALEAARADLFPWLPVCLGVGIGIYFALPVEPEAPAYAALAVLVLAAAGAWLRGPERWRLPAAALLLVALGVLLAGARAHSVADPVLGFRYYGPIEGRITTVDRSSRDMIRLTLDQVVLNNVAPERVPGEVRVTLHGDQDVVVPVPGLRVMMTGHLMPPPGPSWPEGFDFRRHAWFGGLGAVGYIRTPVMALEQPDPRDVLMRGHRARMALSAAIQNRIEGQAGAVAAALMTGDRSGIEEATNESMRASNLYHIISISGLHMGMLAGFVFAFVRYGLALCGNLALRLPTKKIAAGVALVAATGYLWLAGPNVATERSYLMCAVMLVAVLADRRALSLRTLALAAALLLVLKPESLNDAGFQMSFGATAALILVHGPWMRVQPYVPRGLRPSMLLIVASLAAGLSTAPLTALHFNRMAEYGILANFLAVPVMGVLVMPAGVFAAILGPLGLAAPALWIMGVGTQWMILVSDWVAGMEGAERIIATPPGWVLPAMGLGATLAVLTRGAARSLGLVMLALAATGWWRAAPPDVLIAGQGEIVGVMTAEGRALSKDGSAFVAETWLDRDGDGATVSEAAARPGFTGPNGARVAALAGRAVHHLSGREAAQRVDAACRGGAIVVLAARYEGEAPAGDCLFFDQVRLARTGAVTISLEGDDLRIRTTTEAKGARLWSR